MSGNEDGFPRHLENDMIGGFNFKKDLDGYYLGRLRLLVNEGRARTGNKTRCQIFTFDQK
jgi:hypothetical protein